MRHKSKQNKQIKTKAMKTLQSTIVLVLMSVTLMASKPERIVTEAIYRNNQVIPVVKLDTVVVSAAKLKTESVGKSEQVSDNKQVVINEQSLYKAHIENGNIVAEANLPMAEVTAVRSTSVALSRYLDKLIIILINKVF